MADFSEQAGRRAWHRIAEWYRWSADFRREGNSERLKSHDSQALRVLPDVRNLRTMLDEAELGIVRGARREGASWADIAITIGVSRESAWERYSFVDNVSE
jgi:hypothetical protein